MYFIICLIFHRSLLYFIFYILLHQPYPYALLKHFHPHIKSITKYNITIEKKDLKTLHHLLNDKIINFYFHLLEDYSHLFNIKIKTLSTFFYTYLKAYGYNYIRNWFKDDLLTYNYIFIPINVNNHWIFVNIDNNNNTIEVYDSLNTKQSVKEIKYFIIRMTDRKYSIKYIENIPQQKNGIDCGVFTILYARSRAVTRRMHFNNNIKIYRNLIKHEIIIGKIFYTLDDIKTLSYNKKQENNN